MGREGIAPPSGTVTFLFTDIEGSTRLWSEEPRGMSASLPVHDDIVRGAVEEFGGYVFATGGDSFAVAFARGSAAVEAARTIQRRLADADWPGPNLRVRIGLHLGEADERDGNYYGPTVNTAARVESAAHGGQTVLTDAVRVAARVDVTTDLGTHALRDVAEPLHLHQLGSDPFPPLRTLDADGATTPSLPTSWIVVRRPGHDDETIALESELTLGRHVGRPAIAGHLALRGDATVSRLHAMLIPRPAGWCVQTANPTNGLFVNGTSLAPGAVHLLVDGDELRLGERTIIGFHTADPDDDRSQTEAARPAPELDPGERRVLVALCAPVLAGDAFSAPASVAEIGARLRLDTEEVVRRLDLLAERFEVATTDPADVHAQLAGEALARGAVGLADLHRDGDSTTGDPAR